MSDFNSVFEGIDKVRADIDNELSLLQQINKEQKIELEKAKQFNKKMAALGIISLIVSVASLVLTIVFSLS